MTRAPTLTNRPESACLGRVDKPIATLMTTPPSISRRIEQHEHKATIHRVADKAGPVTGTDG